MLKHAGGSLVFEPMEQACQPRGGQSAPCCLHGFPDLIDVFGGMGPRPECAQHPHGGSRPALAATPRHLAPRRPLPPVPVPVHAFPPTLPPQSARPQPGAKRTNSAACRPPRPLSARPPPSPPP